ncbi:MAG TPA: serine hydrolase domain-containing protein [Saprospiraceae bacterium]|nr:serine hydrolase domain-containing protein [Saprospiraceae bacterium]
MPTKIRLLIACCLLFGSGIPLYAQMGLNQKIDAIYADYEDKPGAMVGIWKDGEVLFTKAYGQANLEHELAFTTTTTSDIGSVAKQLSCYAILLLEREGQLSLDDDIRTYLSFVPDFGTPITIRHLMTHTSGLREIYSTEQVRGRRSGDAMFQEDVINMVRRQSGLNFTPGSQFMYCNTAYALLAEIVEEVSSQPFERWMFEYVFEPLGMQRTFIMDRQGEIFPQMAASYSLQPDSVYTKVYDNNTVRGQGGVYSCLEDMMNWIGHMAREWAAGSIVMEKMTEPAVLTDGDTLNYGKGLYVNTFRGLRRIFHSGSSAGYRSGLIYFPDDDLGVFVNVNAPNVPLYETLDLITDFFLKDKMEPIPPRSSTTAPTVQDKLEIPRANDSEWTGTYYSPELETTYFLLLEDGKLKGRHFRHGAFVLKRTGKDAFRSEQPFFPEITFERNRQGRITGFRLTTDRAVGMYFEKQ